MLSAPGGSDSNELLRPCRCSVDGKPLDVARDGHSAPFVGDLDGDGKRDLLVGQYHEGRLRDLPEPGRQRPAAVRRFHLVRGRGKPGRVPEG